MQGRLDISFTAGLNVIIGARGTGKTSVIELIRFCLGVQSYTSETAKRSKEHALSVLGSGQVTVTLSDGYSEIVVSRTADDEEPRFTTNYRRPIIFSQTEIETVGLQSGGRLQLIDGFIPERNRASSAEAEVVANIHALTKEAGYIRNEIEDFTKQVSKLGAIDERLKELAPKELELARSSKESAKKKEALDKIAASLASYSVSASIIDRLKTSTKRWQDSLSPNIGLLPEIEEWPADAGMDPLPPLRSKLQSAHESLLTAHTKINETLNDIESVNKELRQKMAAEESSARALRKEVEALQAGAGEIAREAQLLRESKEKIKSLQNLQKDRERKLNEILNRRANELDKLDAIREERFRLRKATADQLTSTLGPRIAIEVRRAGQYGAYTSAISEALRGSGLRYNDLAPALAEKVSPRELLEAADSLDYQAISDATGISRDRAAKVLSHLSDTDMGEIATVPVEDFVAFQLLDHTDYKDIADLSTGQRCTVILPLVLQHTERVLIVDQPEDHIDNAFIADTLIKSVVDRPENAQIIFSTHNANIPVLGNADHVIQLSSDGRTGSVLVESSLFDTKVVSAISKVMEGGKEAFQQRAKFYKDNVDA
ncbi:AAA family ATPase [uncultured Marinobacter sp.]|uniref:AAA family ATPase n=1 Tax=uncultured Marinobacter sp. TaxID=187379 RepID=UPI00259931DE|nr:AAA family ATPase [uncultured Marinobacter sp.]